MAISTDATIQFWGTETELSNSASPGTIANDAFSDSVNDIDTWTNTDDAPFANFKLDCSFTVDPTAGSVINLYAQLHDIESTSDEPAVNANNLKHYLGSFLLDDGTAQQLVVLPNVTLPNYETQQVYRFWIENQAGQTIDADWSLWINPWTFGPHA